MRPLRTTPICSLQDRCPLHQQWEHDRSLYSLRSPFQPGHLRIHYIENGKNLPQASIYNRDRHLDCLRAFSHYMGLFGHMRINGSGLQRDADTPYSTLQSLALPLVQRKSSPHNHGTFISPSPGQSFVNQAHGDWKTSAWTSGIQSAHPPPQPTLSRRHLLPHGPTWPHAP
ncbi:unnamed protein product [Schistocephalus solidus]|uniref:Fibroblast growth factor 23 n=1 Tax=Schistocephalus solidus TaxID=70667 RepID=A0A183TUL1_SCHSO|nr:unnamed protein product [Schistocephalus solidus]